MSDLPAPPTKPTVYLVGTSSIPIAYAEVLPKWARRFGHRSTTIAPVELGPESDGDACLAFMEFLRDEYHALGAIMATHRATVFEHARHLLDARDADVDLLGEIGVVVRSPGELNGYAPAKTAAQEAYRHTFGEDSDPPAVLIIGADAPARALALALSDTPADAPPRQVTLTTVDGKSMTDMRQRIADLPEGRRPVLRHIEAQLEHDRLVTLLPPGSLVVNAMATTEDNPHSPVGSAALFPENALVWDLGAVGISSPFLDKARKQRSTRGLQLADGPAFHDLQWLASVATVFGAEPNPADAKKLRKQIG